jgi:hypothetical protein
MRDYDIAPGTTAALARGKTLAFGELTSCTRK